MGYDKYICRNPGSNQGPLDLQSNALPTELFRHTITTRPAKLDTLGIIQNNLINIHYKTRINILNPSILCLDSHCTFQQNRSWKRVTKQHIEETTHITIWTWLIMLVWFSPRVRETTGLTPRWTHLSMNPSGTGDVDQMVEIKVSESNKKSGV